MTSTSKKWFIGCGVGCGLFLLVSAGVGVFGFMAVKKIVDRTENIGVSYSVVEDTFGLPEEFIPSPDGRIPASRVEVFLETRRAMAPASEELSRILFILQGEMDGFESSGASWIELSKAGIGLVPALFDYMESRNLAMVEEGMGPGEYSYIYSLAYFNLLGKDPGDGPAFTVTGNEPAENDNGGFRWNVGSASHDEGLSSDDRAREVRRCLNEILGPILRNQMTALQNSGTAAHDPVLQALAVEIAAMDSEVYRLAWEENLPAHIRASLEPFAAELDELYDPIMNAVEIAGANDE